MTLDPRRASLWQAMELGPLWKLRGQRSRIPAASIAGENAAEGTSAEPDASTVSGVVTQTWEALQHEVSVCAACNLCRSRTQTVFGVGSTQARWMLIGEAPGAEEDARGEPFVGQAGKLLDAMLASLGLSRQLDRDPQQSVYIANVLKCRPPSNRDPQPDEVARCASFLKRQIVLLQPKLIIVMGRFAAQSLLGSDASIASLRGQIHEYEVDGRRVPVVVSYHPAYLLRNLADKSKAWADLCLARRVFNGP